jgi:hypothetical protein
MIATASKIWKIAAAMSTYDPKRMISDRSSGLVSSLMNTSTNGSRNAKKITPQMPM